MTTTAEARVAYEPRTYWKRLHADGEGLPVVGYPELGKAFNRWQYRARLAAFERLLDDPQLWPAGRPALEQLRVLDGAFGVGAYARWFARQGVQRYVGVDLSSEAVERGRAAFPLYGFLQADLAELEGPARRRLGEFDVVTAIDVLYHITDDERCGAALRNLSRCVAPEGILVFSDVLPDEPYDAAGHVRRRPLSFYRDLLLREGFAMVSLQPVFFALGDPVPSVRDPWLYALCQGLWRPTQKLLRTLSGAPPVQNALGHALGAPLHALDRFLQPRVTNERVGLNLVAARRVGPPRPIEP